MRVTQSGDRTVLNLHGGHPRAKLVLPAEEGIYPRSLDATRIVAEEPGRLLIIVSDYASRPNGPTHQCGAGTETVVRVIALLPVAHQTLARRIASCWSTIEDGEVAWNGATGLLTLRWVIYDPEMRSVQVSYKVSANGEVALLEPLPR